eukprot:gene5743-6037_t
MKFTKLAAESVRHKRERQRLEDKLANSQSQGGILEDKVQRLIMKLDIAEAANEAARSTWLQSSATEVQILKLEATAAQEELQSSVTGTSQELLALVKRYWHQSSVTGASQT